MFDEWTNKQMKECIYMPYKSGENRLRFIYKQQPHISD